MAVDKGQESTLMALAPDPWCYSNGGLGSGSLLIWAGMWNPPISNSSEERKLHSPRSCISFVIVSTAASLKHLARSVQWLNFNIHIKIRNYASHEYCGCKCLCSKSWVLFCVIDTSVRRDLHHLCPLVCPWRVTSQMHAPSTSKMKMVQMHQGKSMKQTHVKGMLKKVYCHTEMMPYMNIL